MLRAWPRTAPKAACEGVRWGGAWSWGRGRGVQQVQRPRGKEPEGEGGHQSVIQDGGGGGQSGRRSSTFEPKGQRAHRPGAHAAAACCARQGTGASVCLVLKSRGDSFTEWALAPAPSLRVLPPWRLHLPCGGSCGPLTCMGVGAQRRRAGCLQGLGQRNLTCVHRRPRLAVHEVSPFHLRLLP